MNPTLSVPAGERPIEVAALLAESINLPVVLLALGLAGVTWWLYAIARQRTAELRRSEERFRGLFEHAVEGVYENPADGGFRSANPAMARMLGYESPEALARLTPEQTAGIYVSPTRRQEFLVALGAGDQVMNFESEVRRPDGTTIWISENVRATRDASGRLLLLQGFVTDITARKQAEVSLRSSEQRYRELFEHSPVAILELDSRATLNKMRELRAGGVTDFSAWLQSEPAEAAKMIRHFPLMGLNTAALKLLAATSLEDVQANLGRILTPEAVEMRKRALDAVWAGRNQVEGETRIMALDGRVRTIYQRWWVPVDGDRLVAERTQLAFVDLTEARSAEQALAGALFSVAGRAGRRGGGQQS